MSDRFPIVIHHNPECGTSRNVLAMIEAAGYTPTVIPYLETGWTITQLQGLLAAMNLEARDLLRDKGTPAKELGLLDESAMTDDILREMVAYPVLVNRPIVVTPLGAKLCRPSEMVLALLERKPGTFVKEDGEVVRL